MNLEKIIFNFQIPIYNKFSMNQLSNNYNLKERTANFGESIIDFCKNLKQDALFTTFIYYDKIKVVNKM